MKKIDKLVLDAFLGPFLITFLVVVFILLNIQMIKYFDDIIGKGLDWIVLGQLFFYFGVITTPTALPLAVLLSALIAYGNLGEHFELTAIKGAGISLVRTIQPIFFFVVILTVMAFYLNNNLVPKAALEAYSLLYDIKQKKPSLDLREGAFYNGIPDISIKVNHKVPDENGGEMLKDIIIYDHRKNDGNKEVTIADSGRMFTILNERYLKLELFNGYRYTEGMTQEAEMIGQKKRNRNKETMSRSKFEKTQVVFDLSSFQLERTDKKWFQGNRIMRNLSELDTDQDSIRREILSQELAYYQTKPTLFQYYNHDDSVTMPKEVARYREWRDSTARAKYLLEEKKREMESKAKITVNKPTVGGNDSTKTTVHNKAIDSIKAISLRKLPLAKNDLKSKPSHPGVEKAKRQAAITRTTPKITETKKIEPKKTAKDTLDPVAYRRLVSQEIDSIFKVPPTSENYRDAANMVRQAKSRISNNTSGVDRFEKELIIFRIQWHKIIANAFACIAMFMIGAPLGSIIKKGGLGVPFLVSIFFFIIYYVISIQGEKLAKQETIGVTPGVWMPDIILLLVGLVFLRQARNDARLFDFDSYLVAWDKFKLWVKSRKQVHQANPA